MTTTFPPSSYIYAPNKLINIGQCYIAVREPGQESRAPNLLLNHWGANLDDFDFRIINRLAEKHHVIAVNYCGVGSSTGGFVAQEMTIFAAQLVRRLILVGTGPKRGKLAAESFLSSIKQRQNRESGLSLLLYLIQLIALTKWDIGKPHKLEDIRTPILIVNVNNDLVLPSKSSHKMSKKIPNSQ